MTFLELYQTLLGFVFYKLYSDINLVYPPRLDEEKDDAAAGIGARLLEETSRTLTIEGKKGTEEGLDKGDGKKVTAKDVKKQIRQIAHGTSTDKSTTVEEGDGDESMAVIESTAADATGTEFPTPLEGGDSAPAPEQDISDLFASYHFFLSREVTRPTLEFIIRSFGGRVGWDPVLGAGSPFEVSDPRITHHIVDRPIPPPSSSTSKSGLSSAVVLASYPGKRAYIQPQWVVDCINQKKLLPTEQYAPGQTLPPHLSPFVDADKVKEQGGYIPTEAGGEAVSEGSEDEDVESNVEQDAGAEEEEEEEETGFGDGDESMQTEEVVEEEEARPALMAAAQNPEDTTLMHAAELEAESLSIPYSTFTNELAALRKSGKTARGKSSSGAAAGGVASTQEANPASILLSNKQRRLYNKMKFGEARKNQEAEVLKEKKKKLVREEGKKGK